MPKPMHWKWKVLIGFVIFVMFCVVFVLTPWGQGMMYDHIKSVYDSTPETERRALPQADSFLTLAWWRGNICQDDKAAMGMYREFCGLPTNVRDDGGVFDKGKLPSQFCSPDGTTGWGPAHPRAPEAFWSFLEFYQVDHNQLDTFTQCLNYYRLFYTWMARHGPDKKPHPLFNKYWPKVKELMSKRMFDIPQDIDMKAPKAAPYTPPPDEAPSK